jgi:hypothetical protein
MTDERPSQDIASLWRNQETKGTTMTLADIHTRADKFRTRVRWRNAIEYVASAFVIAVFGFYAYVSPNPLFRLSSLAIVVATVFVVWQLRRKGSARNIPGGGTNVRDFVREELVRQRDLVRSAWLWYVLPFTPGLLLAFIARWMGAPVRGRSLEADHTIIVLSGVIVVLMMLGVILWNVYTATRLQKAIDDLDRS